ncbi:MAG: metallophosphoesterase [Campylobacterota bacterium]|nr:metallophosphoesterase [Campylobacterota bacterium]
MRILIFTVLFLTVFTLLNLYISKRLVKHLDLSKKVKKYLNIFLVVNFLGIIGYMFARYYVDFPNWLYFLFSLPIGVLFLLFCTAIVYDISRVLLGKVSISNERRAFFKKSLDISSLGVAGLLMGRALYEARFIELEKVEIKIDNLKKSYKIVQLSDVHIGGLIDAKFIKDIVTRVNNLNADLVVITGDLIDVDVKSASKPLEELSKLKSKYGTYFCVGNHEYFHGIESIIKTVKSIGINVLENESVYIGDKGYGFNLAGVYDVMGYRVDKFKPDIKKALKDTKDSPIVLLAHQPRYIEEVGSEVDLVLSGHTHGGQLYPFRLLVKLQQPYISGLYQHNSSTQIYVNKGTGFWGPPMRLGASSEITEIIIV